MGFGNFASNLGLSATGVNQADTERNALQESNMRIKNEAIATRANQVQEAAENQRLAQLKADNQAAMNPNVSPPQQSNFDYGSSAAPVTAAPAMISGGNPNISANRNVAPVQPQAQDVDYHNGAVAYQNAIAGQQAKLDALRASPGYQAARNHAALAYGVNAPIAATRDVINAPYNALGYATDTLANGAAYVGNAITGKDTFNTNNNGFVTRGMTPRMDALNATGANNFNTPEEQKILSNIDQYQKAADTANTLQLGKLKAAHAAIMQGTQGVQVPAIGSAKAPEDNSFPSIIKFAENSDSKAVSKKGAAGNMQVMQNTLTDPGFGVAPARDGSIAEKERVGRDYANALLKTYRDPALAAVAYNWGPSNTNDWITDGKDFSKLPKETRNYIDRIAPYLHDIRGTGPTQQYQNQGIDTTQNTATTQAPAATAVSGNYAYQQAPFDSPKAGADAEALRQANIALQTAPTSAAYAAASAHLQDLKLNSFSENIMRVGYSASKGDPQALGSLVGQFGAYHGQQFGVVPMSDGTFQMVKAGPDGKPIAWGQPSSVANLASEIMTNIVPSLRQAAATRAAARATEDDKNVSKGIVDIAVSRNKSSDDFKIKGMQEDQANYRAKLQEATKNVVAKLALSGKDAKTFQANNSDGSQNAYIVSGGVIEQIVPGKTVNGIVGDTHTVKVGSLPSGARDVSAQYSGGGDGVNNPLISGILNAPPTAGLTQPYLSLNQQ